MFLTADEIVKKYIEIRDFIRAADEEHEKKLKVYKDGLKVLEGAAAQLIRDTKQTSLHTEWGTAYQEPGISTTVEDDTLWFRFVFALGPVQARNFLTTHVAKDAVKAYIEGVGQGHPPPGVKVVPYIKTLFRRL